MSKEIELLEDLAVCVAGLACEFLMEENRGFRSCRVNPYLKNRKQKGRFHSDFVDMSANKNVFYENFHMTLEKFNDLFSLVELELAPKKNTRPHDNISEKEKLAVTLEYLASGSLQRHVASIYRISKSHLGRIIDQVCDAICNALKSEIPQIDDSFLDTANEYFIKWNFPNCVGSIDGKHVAVKCPDKAGSLFYNYKGYHSLVLLAVADASCKFTYIDVGGYGSEGDANVFAESSLGKSLRDKKLRFPPDASVNNEILPFFFLADDAFPLCERIMKPYSGRHTTRLTTEERIFNYRLSRARRCVENAFGILCAKWQCLKRTMFCSPDRAQKIVATCCYLHNYLMRTSTSYCPPRYMDTYDESGNLLEGDWRLIISEASMFSNNLSSCRGRSNNMGKSIRDKLKTYFYSEFGAVSWQQDKI